MGKKLMIFGGGGFIGGNLTRVAQQKGWEVYAVDNRPRLQAEWRTADISDKDTVDEVIRSVSPEAVVNLAAIADIDQAEREKELAHRVNVDGAELMFAPVKTGRRWSPIYRGELLHPRYPLCILFQ